MFRISFVPWLVIVGASISGGCAVRQRADDSPAAATEGPATVEAIQVDPRAEMRLQMRYGGRLDEAIGPAVARGLTPRAEPPGLEPDERALRAGAHKAGLVTVPMNVARARSVEVAR